MRKRSAIQINLKNSDKRNVARMKRSVNRGVRHAAPPRIPLHGIQTTASGVLSYADGWGPLPGAELRTPRISLRCIQATFSDPSLCGIAHRAYPPKLP